MNTEQIFEKLCAAVKLMNEDQRAELRQMMLADMLIRMPCSERVQ